MDSYHRSVILTNIDTLTEWTDYDKLKDGCIDTKILSIETVGEIEVRKIVILIVILYKK